MAATTQARPLASVPTDVQAPDALQPIPGPTTAPGGAPADSDKPDWVWPVDGEVVTPFDSAKQKGILIAVAPDAPVRAVADGTVSYVGTYLDYGKLVIITHDERLRTVYGQNKTLVVKQGQRVRRGEMIATAGGNRGDPGAARFRFEVRVKGTPSDPLPFLPAR
jgi:lipoprotein NlpD